MKIVIIPEDGAVYLDGFSYDGLNLMGINIPADVHALQWHGEKGWIEFKDWPNGFKPQNQDIHELPDWANACVNQWYQAKRLEQEAMVQRAADGTITTQGVQSL